MTEKSPFPEMQADNFNKILISLIVVFLTLVVFALYKRKQSAKRRGILLTGLCGSGKTVLFSELVHGKPVSTYTSIKENTGDYAVQDTILKIIDIPGHERLRDKYLGDYKSVLKGIVFVVDSLTIQKDIKDAAEYLYNILVDPVIVANKPSLLILCNKQDQTLAKGCKAVKSMFERELNTLRLTKSKQLQSVDPKAKDSITLGDSNKDFDFSMLPLKVEFAECSEKSENEEHFDVTALKQWLSVNV